MESFDQGDTIRATATFSGDPTAVTFLVRNQAGTTTTYVYGDDVEVIRSSAGVYYVDVIVPTTSSNGRWHVRAEGSGSNAAATERPLEVVLSRVR